MPLINEDLLRRQVPIHKSIRESARELQRGAIKSFGPKDTYDIFLSHAYLDAQLIEGLKRFLEKRGLSVYVDWIENPELDRSRVTPETADVLREAIRRSAGLLYAASTNADNSRWMPWELGYADGFHSRVAVLPIARGANTAESFKGSEYLGLYPFIDGTSTMLWVNKAIGLGFVKIQDWLKGAKP